MKRIKTVTALTAAFFLAASLTVCGSSYSAAAQTLNTPGKNPLSAATGTAVKPAVSSTGSEEDPALADYAGEYIMFGLGSKDVNFQNKKVVVSNEGMESGSLILNADGTGVAIDGDPADPDYREDMAWSVSDGNITITGDYFEFTGTIEDGVIMIGYESSPDTLYFALEEADLSSYSIVNEDDYEMLCIAGTYYLTNETLDDGSTFLNRTQISWNVLDGLGEASLKLYEDGTGALDVGDHQDIVWNTDSIILNDEEYFFDFAEGVITLEMSDYTMEFTYIGEGDIYLQLTLDEVTKSVEKIKGDYYPLGDSGLKYYVPDSYVMYELTEEDIADDLVSNFVEETDINENDYYDNDIYALHYLVYDEDDLPDIELLLDHIASLDATADYWPMIINGREFACGELVYEDTDEHLFLFRTWDDKGYITDIKYRTEESIMTDDFRSLVFKLASAICPDA